MSDGPRSAAHPACRLTRVGNGQVTTATTVGHVRYARPHQEKGWAVATSGESDGLDGEDLSCDCGVCVMDEAAGLK